MDIRITSASDAHETVLRVDGHLRRENVAELTKEHRSVDGPLVLELSNLQSADAAAVHSALEKETCNSVTSCPSGSLS